jgi:hypothetical protein
VRNCCQCNDVQKQSTDDLPSLDSMVADSRLVTWETINAAAADDDDNTKGKGVRDLQCQQQGRQKIIILEQK